MSATDAKTFEWTEQQAAAIAHREGNLVVSASAGSGKTAVLTERVLQLVTGTGGGEGERREPVALERLLILTFTEKAARQMRERIEARLKEALRNAECGMRSGESSERLQTTDHGPKTVGGGSIQNAKCKTQNAKPDAGQAEALRAALDALPGAWVMTIDAFCRRVVVEHFHRAGLSPDPRAPEAAELAQLERETLERLLEEWAGDAARRGRLAALLEATAGGAAGVAAAVQQLMRFLEVLDDPAAWTAEARRRIELTLAADRYEMLPEAFAAAGAFRRATAMLAGSLRETIALARGRAHDAGHVARWAAMAERLDAIGRGGPCFRPDAMRDEVEATLAPVLGKTMNKGVCGKDLYGDEGFRKAVLERFAKQFETWRAAWFGAAEGALLRGAQLAARHGEALVELAEAATARMGEAKRRRGWVSFNDFERKALEILSDPADPHAPSDVAQAMRAQFHGVLVDEFQDTSPLQHRIVTRVAREDEPGNLFVVGDYKQSIYRFRHAEPDLFLSLIDPEHNDYARQGARFRHLPLSRNFRSRPGILLFANALFERLMDREVGEIDYRQGEQLDVGRTEEGGTGKVCVEARWLLANAECGMRNAESMQNAKLEMQPPDRQEGLPNAECGMRNAESMQNAKCKMQNGEVEPRRHGDAEETEELRGAEGQAAWVARRIRELGAKGEAAAGDCAILLRGLKGELDVWVGALEREGLKVRAQGIDPLLTAQETMDLLSALRVADNPFQDIALAAAMRSPLGGFTDEELLRIRMAGGSGAFWEEVWESADPASRGYAGARCEMRNAESMQNAKGKMQGVTDEHGEASTRLTPELRNRLAAFVGRVNGWRKTAREGSAEEVLEAILKDAAYEAWLSGEPEAAQKRMHMDFLRGLVRKPGAAAGGRNPLATFLEQIDRAAQDAGKIGELPEPVGGESDAVQLMTIHAAKGLEFPVVFLPRLERKFHAVKASDAMADRDHGLAMRGVDGERRRKYPTPAHRVLSEARRQRERSEELRLLYVAMTRAKERLVLVAQVGNREALRQRAERLDALDEQPIAALERLQAGSPLDLIGPVVEWLAATRRPAWLEVGEIHGVTARRGANREASLGRGTLARALCRDGTDAEGDWRAAVAELCAEAGIARAKPAGVRLLPTVDPARALTTLPMKTTVTALRRRAAGMAETTDGWDEAEMETEAFGEEEMRAAGYRRDAKAGLARPRWVAGESSGSGRLEGALRGTVTHQVLARVGLSPAPTMEALRAEALRALARCGVKCEHEDAAEGLIDQLDLEGMLWFFGTEAGRKMIERPQTVSRELAVTARKGVADFDPEAHAAFPGEAVLMQGIVDVAIDEGKMVTVLDYKTDWVAGADRLAVLTEQYRLQVELYAKAIKAIWQVEKVRSGLAFLGAREIVWVE
jgi:ATP-dependent helicase/nuclease subunit A